MGVIINHTISFLTSPLAVSMALVLLGLCLLRKWRKVSVGSIAVGLFWLYAMSTNLVYGWLGMGLEREYPPVRVEELPKADAIAVLGGGVGCNTNTVYYAELFGAADRVVHAARIWKAGKAPAVIPSGKGDLDAARPFLLELGVPESAILVENEAMNTEQNAKFVAEFVKAHHKGEGVPKVIVVTSAWHMPRTMLLFKKYADGIEVIPGACDYEATVDSDRFNFFKSIIPNADSLLRNSYMLKEYIGYLGYRLLKW